jgi:hypothetical protein
MKPRADHKQTTIRLLSDYNKTTTKPQADHKEYFEKGKEYIVVPQAFLSKIQERS